MAMCSLCLQVAAIQVVVQLHNDDSIAATETLNMACR